MLNKLMMGVALSALALTGAMAQSTPSPSATQDKPAATDSSKPSTDMNKSSTSGAGSTSTDASKPASGSSASTPSSSSTASSSTGSTTGAATTGEAKFVSTQSPDQFLASKFEGTDVVGADDKKIGDVSDVLFDKEGKIEAYVISVGGFLGVGAKDVALAPSAFEVVKGTDGKADKLRLSMSKDQLTQAQGFEPYKPPQATTGAGAARPGGMGGGSSGMRPASPPASTTK